MMNDVSQIDVITRQNVGTFSLWTAANNVGPTAVSVQTVSARPAKTGMLPVATALFLLLAGSLGLHWRLRRHS